VPVTTGAYHTKSAGRSSKRFCIDATAAIIGARWGMEGGRKVGCGASALLERSVDNKTPAE